MSAIDCSVVVPVYFNQGCLWPMFKELHEEITLRNPNYRYEVIFVDDGSRDESFRELLEIQATHPDLVTVIKFTRNFGQANAVLAGYRQAVGKCVTSVSADGQDPPELITQMVKAHLEEGYDVALCARQGRDESFYRIFTSRLFYGIIQKLSFANMPTGGFDIALMGRRALNTFLATEEANPFFQGQILWPGYKTKMLDYYRRSRIAGESKWSFGRKLTYLIDGVLAYSFAPVRFISAMGIFSAFLGFAYAALVFVGRLVWGNPVKGWAPLMVVILVMGGMQMLMIGIIGEYVWRTLAQVRKREMYVVDRVIKS